MKKKIILMILAVAFLITLCSCGKPMHPGAPVEPMSMVRI